MTTKIETFYYPNNINSPEFENRKVVFLSLTGKDILQSRADLYEKYKNGVDVTENVDGMVTLPLNAAINDSQSHDWAESDYLSTLKNVTGKVNDKVEKEGSAKWKSIFKWGNGVVTALEAIGGLASTGAELFGVRKPMINPGQFQNYTKSSLRSFSFEFVFIPENTKERDQVIEIVKFFKRSASPSLPGKLAQNGAEVNTAEAIMSKLSEAMMLSPHTWEIFVCNPHINKLMSFHECVCKNVSVTYGDSEKVAMFEDGMPKQISLKLDFAETSLQFSDSYGDTTIYEEAKETGKTVPEVIDNKLEENSSVYRYIKSGATDSLQAFKEGRVAEGLGRALSFLSPAGVLGDWAGSKIYKAIND